MRIRPPAGKSLVFSLTALLGALLSVHDRASAKPSFAIRPEPAWVKTIEFNRNNGSRERPTSILLKDLETKLSGSNVDRFYKRSERVNTSAGLERVSQLQFYFEPSYQSLVIHFIRIIRDGQSTNALEPAAIKIIAKEDELEDQIYNGTFAAVIFLKDIRVGDIVEYAYTVSGDNPVFKGLFADRFYLADEVPIQNLRVRLLSPFGRSLYFRNQGTEIAAKVTAHEDETEYLWERSEVPGIEFEDFTPRWFEPIPSVSISEFADWHAVVQWAEPLYEIDQPLPPELKKKAEDWIRQSATQEQRMIAALRFVQQEIRYLGIELGPYSHRPSRPSQTLSRRFGDCKDKSLLLYSVFKHMGIDCAVALVNTSAGRMLDNYQASPEAFDHAIVQTKINGRTFWLDPTIESQRGNVDAYYDPFYERALVLKPDVRGLETIPEPKVKAPTTEVREYYTLESAGRALLRVTTTYRGADADEMRYRWSQRSAEEMGKFYLNYYADNNPSIRSDGPPKINDNEQDNIVSVEESYVIDSFWSNQSHYFSGETTYEELPKPNISKRSMPLALRHPTFLSQMIQVDSVTSGDVGSHTEVIANDAFRFEYNLQQAAGSLRISYLLQTYRDYVPADKVPAYLAQADRIWNSTGLRLPIQTVGVVRRSDTPSVDSIKLFMALFAGLLMIGVLIVIKVRHGFQRQPTLLKPQPGAAPETALRCKNQNDIEALTKGFKCRCGTHPFRTEALSHQETLFYDGERLGTVKLKCDTCGRTNDLYFVQPTGL